MVNEERYLLLGFLVEEVMNDGLVGSASCRGSSLNLYDPAFFFAEYCVFG